MVPKGMIKGGDYSQMCTQARGIQAAWGKTRAGHTGKLCPLGWQGLERGLTVGQGHRLGSGPLVGTWPLSEAQQRAAGGLLTRPLLPPILWPPSRASH